VVELSALGVPFVAIPLDYHFEQEYVMAHRLKHYGVGKLITLRDHSPNEIAEAAKQAVGRPVQRVPTDNGTEVSQILLDVARSHKISVDA
jgi:UDP:flavonoid glycosyltransferase YjiC (YdhE family)